MSSISVKVEGRSGDYLKVLPVPASQATQSSLDAIDVGIVSFFLLCASGLICLLLLG